MKHLLRLIAALIAVPLLCIGCNKSVPKPEPGAASSPSGEKAALPAAAASAAGLAPAGRGSPLRIAYSDWPGWVAWDIAIQKGWFKEAGVEVDFKWFEYVPSMDAYAAGKVDAVCMTNGDSLVTGSSGAPSVGILINDYSNGNDMVVARPGITSVAQLRGKKVGVEVGYVSHLLLMNALRSAKMTDKDIEILNVPTDQTPQTLKSGKVDAIVAWQPNSGQALKVVPGSKPIFTSANVPGIIYDQLAVSPKSLAERRADWVKVIKVWLRVADFIKNEKNIDEATKIMSARVGLEPEEYKPLMKGTFFLDLAGNQQHWKKAEGLESIFGSSKAVDDFNQANKVYKAPVKYLEYFDGSLLEEAAKK